MNRCHWTHTPAVGRVFIPGCMGAAVYGPHRCTCKPRWQRSELEDLRAEAARLSAKLDAMAVNDGGRIPPTSDP